MSPCEHLNFKSVERGGETYDFCRDCPAWRGSDATRFPPDWLLDARPKKAAPTKQKRPMPADAIDAAKVVDLVESYRALSPGERSLARQFMAAEDGR